MENENKSAEKGLINKLFGGIDMSWKKILLLAVGSAVLTAIFLIVPIFRNSSFERMGVYLEAWFFLAILIMSNCKKPLESAVKTFVFFLVSQPLIYLIQVPFSDMGFGLFGYYKYWFIATLATFPMAFIGWYIKKKNWLSLLIIAPVLMFMGVTAYQSGLSCMQNFPRLLVTTLFCILQIVLYVLAFCPDAVKRVIGFLIPGITVAVFAFIKPQVDVNGTVFLPDDRILTDSAVVIQDEGTAATVAIESTGEDSMLRVRAQKYGTSEFTIRDGGSDYRYTVQVYEDETGHAQIKISPIE
ncbi:MAG TPA: hypothetical protein P5092_10100 [Ruminococcus sp.]|nr:hypothetical protein [Ruminococcus sp.]